MIAGSLRVVASGTLARTSDRLLGSLYLVTGALLCYLVLFDQGAALSVFFSTAGRENLLHEFFHDGRHLWNAPCH